MKKWAAFLFICCLTNNFSQTNISPQFSELKGIEDQQGNTHLFYRIFTIWYDSVNQWMNSSENIYHLDLFTGEDSLFLPSYYKNFEDFYVNDFTFWSGSPGYYIYGGATEITILNEHTFIYRFDSNNRFFRNGVVRKIEVSEQDNSLLYAGVSVLDSTILLTIKSTDGGWNWEGISGTYEFISLNPFDDQIFFSWEIMFKNLFKTTDGGVTYSIVDSSMTYWEQQYHYDADENHIYRVARNFSTNNYELKVSSDGGEVFTWGVKYTSPDKFFISNNSSAAGEIYLADKKNIYLSTNFGNNFALYKTLERKIIGIYKKPNSDKLYAATKYKIYEITPDTIKVIKSLPIPDEVFNFYPLSIGNKWVYEVYTSGIGGTEYQGDETKSIIDTSTLNNGQTYFLYKYVYINGESDTTYLRLDSLTGKLYAHSFETGNDLFFEDLLAEAGDTVCYEYNPAWNCQYVQPDSQFTEFGLNTIINKYFPQAPGWYFGHSLVRGIGLYEVYNGDLVTYSSTLKGCVINGVVYGDTTVVSVEREKPLVASSFKLEQNYPNPFNPKTKIKFTIPSVETTRRVVFTTLKVYDVLGNEVETLVNQELSAGEYEIEFDGQNLPSGIYFYQLKAESYIYTRKMIYLK